MGDADSDGDGTPDCTDGCPTVPNKVAPGACGCGTAEGCEDLCPDDPLKREPGICGCHFPDIDNDADGSPDCIDECPYDPTKLEPGECGCDVPDGTCDGEYPDVDGGTGAEDIKKKGCGCVTVGTGTSGDGMFGLVLLIGLGLVRQWRRRDGSRFN